MAISQIGQVTRQAAKNFRPYGITPQQRQEAERLAEGIKRAGKNWIPVMALERDCHDLELVGDPTILEAVKISGIGVVHTILLENTEEAIAQASGEISNSTVEIPEEKIQPASVECRTVEWKKFKKSEILRLLPNLGITLVGAAKFRKSELVQFAERAF